MVIEPALVRVYEPVLVVETLRDGGLTQLGETNGVVLATTVDADKPARLKIKDIPADSASSDID